VPQHAIDIHRTLPLDHRNVDVHDGALGHPRIDLVLDGQADAVLHVLARDVGHLEQVIEQIRATPSIDATRSEIVLSTLIRRKTP
jgi:hypothetical protein